MLSTELVIIGAGPGGYVAAIRAAQLGIKTTLIEREKLGGVCLHWGCIPSKALIHGAHIFDMIKHAGEFGIRLPGEPTVDYAALVARKDRSVTVLEKGVEMLVNKRGVQVIKGQAAFTDAQTLSLRKSDGSVETLSFQYAIIATGGEPMPLPGFPMDGTTFITSNEVLRWTSLPASIAIIGAGVIGCEFASLYARLGVPVQVIELQALAVPGFDEDIRREVGRALTKQGVQFFFETKVDEATAGPGGATLTLSNGETIGTQVCVVAVGRQPVSEPLHPAKAGLMLGRRGAIPVDSRCRTNIPNIFAIGDVTGALPLAHAASHMGLVAAEQIARCLSRGGADMEFDPAKVPVGVFTEPEAAAIGITEAQAKEKGYTVKVGKFPFRGLGRAHATGSTDGFVKVVADAATGKLLGIHMVGHNAMDLLGEASLAMSSNSSLEDLAHAVHVHPTLTEAIGEAALLALGRGIHAL